MKLLVHPLFRRKRARRSPCGERGLKFSAIHNFELHCVVAPRVGSVG